MALHLLKLCVGAESVEDQRDWMQRRLAMMAAAGQKPEQYHTTRMVPKRAAELVDGGSLYWVFKGVCLARQRVIRLDEVIGQDGIPRCGIVLDPEITRTTPMPRRPFQGWRYLTAADAPADLSDRARKEDPLPASLNAALAEIGVL